MKVKEGAAKEINKILADNEPLHEWLLTVLSSAAQKMDSKKYEYQY